MAFVWVDFAFFVGAFAGWLAHYFSNRKADREWAEVNLCPDCLSLWKYGKTEDGRKSFESEVGR